MELREKDKNKILSKYKMAKRRINLVKIGRVGRKNLRIFAGVSKTKGLVDAYNSTGLTPIADKVKAVEEAYKYFGGLYNASIDEVPPIIVQTSTRYSGQISFRVEVKRIGGSNKVGQGNTRTFIAKYIDVPLLKMSEINKLEKLEIKKLLSQSPYLSVVPLRSNLTKHRIRRPVNTIMTAPIKEAGAIELDGLIKNSVWCKNNGLCVPDWLIHKYLNCTRTKIKKKVKDADVIQYHSTHDIEGNKVIDNVPNTDGYTIENIMLFCKNANLPVYILRNGQLIQHSRNASVGHTKHGTPLVIEVKNGHLYPITNATEIKRIVHIPTSNGVAMAKKKEADEEVVKSKNPEKLCFDDDYTDALFYYLNTQRIQNTQQYPNKARLIGNRLSPFKIADTTYISAEKDVAIEAYVVSRCKEYMGQTAPSLISVYMDKMPQSYLNHEVMSALTITGVKNRTHIGLYRDYEDDYDDEHDEHEEAKHEVSNGLPYQIDINKTKCIDVNKAYRDVMERPPDDFMTIGFNSVIEEVKTFTAKKFGLWFVETDDLTLQHQSNWYSTAILDMATKDKIKFKPKYFIAGKREGVVLLNTMIQEINDTNPNNDPDWRKDNGDELGEKVDGLIKTMINSISGMLGRTTKKSTYLTCDTDIERVWEDYFKKPEKWEGDFIFRTLEADETNPALYCWGRVQRQELLTNNLPMYIQILDWANMALHKLVKSTGGYDHLLYRKTDFIMMEDIGQKLNPTKDIGGYKIEDPPKRFVDMDDIRHVEYEYKPVPFIQDTDIKTSDDYDKVIARLESGKSLLLDSRAGTGKSYIINKVSEHFGEKAVRRIAFTNKASNNINGQTIHKFFGIDRQSKLNLTQLRKRMGGVKVVCIDEISMIGQELWKHIYFVRKYFKDAVFLLCGEEAQLPPIETGDRVEGYFNHPTIMMMCDYTYASLNLTDKCRYDRELYNYLTNIKDGLPNKKRPISTATLTDYLGGTNLVYTNKTRMNINTILNNYHTLNADNYLTAVWEGDGEEVVGEKYRQTTNVYNNMPLLVFKSDTQNGLIKNTVHIVKDLDITKGTFKIENNSGEFIIGDINNKFIMAYAMTIHKAQGDTIDGKLNIHEYYRIEKDRRLYYTAVSRGRNLENIKYFK